VPESIEILRMVEHGYLSVGHAVEATSIKPEDVARYVHEAGSRGLLRPGHHWSH
jgi:hypothetical protein